MKETLAKKIFAYTVLIIVFALVLFPLIYVFACSFKTNSEIMAHPEIIFTKSPTFNNYIECWTSPDFHVPTLLSNSLIYTIANVITSHSMLWLLQSQHIRMMLI